MIIDSRIRDDDRYIVLDVTGGHGKNIQVTAVIRAIKKQYPNRKVVVVGSWDSPYFYNPNIFRFYLQNQFFYFKDDFLKEDTIIMKHDPYNETNHILRKEHLTETWCKMFDIPYDGYKPDIFINPRELEIAKDKIKPDGREILLYQPSGGNPSTQYSKKSWYRDMPIEIAQDLANFFSKKYRVLHIKTPEQPVLQNVEVLNLPLRELYGVFPLSTKRLFIDSFASHLAAGLGLQSTVCWIGNSHKVFGYPEHINIYPNAKIINNLDRYTYLNEDISGFIQAFPYDTINLFDINEIINAVERQK
jgi:ADP-heptose:LPS heptosyltransferase